MHFFVKNRILCTRLIAIICLLVVLVSYHSWEENSLLDLMVQWTGFCFIVIATLGRIWCFVYISGYKEDELITIGPYSLVRNPLYCFSFIGAIGLGLATENVLSFSLMIILFCILYPSVIEEEESTLMRRYGDLFEDYQRKIPRWIPQFKYYNEPEEYMVKPRIFLKSMLESMWFMWFYMILQMIESLHQFNILPKFFLIP